MRAREIVLTAHAEQLFFRAVLVVVLVGFSWKLSRPSALSRLGDLFFAALTAALCWILFRAGFRTRLVARADGLQVVNVASTVRIPLPAVEAIVLDWLGIRIQTTDGRRVRVWGVPDSLLDARGGRGADLAVRHLGDIVERFGGTSGTVPQERSARTGHRRRGPAVWRAVQPPQRSEHESAAVQRHGVFPDWWAFLGPLALFSAAVLLRSAG